MIIDTAQIYVKSGKGGDGCVSFLRMKYIPKGGPNGGDGGDGGSVILRADPEVETLLDFAGRHHWRAQPGEMGRGKQQYGKNGEDLIIRLPPGTLVYDADTGERIVDLDREGMTFVVAKGGKGGRGNEYLKTPTNQSPREAEPGEPAVELNLSLELKLIADVGLLGKPNAGKSTLLSVVSAAEPKVADYPFTTLVPQLGIAELPSGSGKKTGGGGASGATPEGYNRRLVIADIPGLIEKASEGAGLGTRFLRHVERTKLLIHVLEPEPEDGSDPLENYHVIRQELASHSSALAEKPEIIALSKIDLLGGPEDHAVAQQMIAEALNKPVLTFSSATRIGLSDLLEEAWARLHAAPDAAPAPGWRDKPAQLADAPPESAPPA
ncbi:MAG: GTPase ObgE [Planctomycetota bacterium]